MQHVLTPVSVLVLFGSFGFVFFGCFVASAHSFYAGKAFAFKDAVISMLTSPGFNPHGYLAADVGLVLTGVVLLPVAVWLFFRLRGTHYRLAGVGSGLFACGLLGIMLLGVTAPFEHRTNSLHHILLAYAAFLSFALGILVLLIVAASEERRPILRRLMGAAALLQGVSLGSLLYLLWRQLDDGRAFFDDRTLLRSMAFCQWLLCAENALCLYVLAYGVAAASRHYAPQPKSAARLKGTGWAS